jgi:ribosomal protein L5
MRINHGGKKQPVNDERKVPRFAANKRSSYSQGNPSQSSKKDFYMNSIYTYSSIYSKRDYSFKFNSKNIFQIPDLKKIVLNSRIKSGVILNPSQEKKKISATFLSQEMITGQKTKTTRAKSFIAGFKLRKGQLVGCMITLRKQKMYSFLEKIIHIILPKIREFEGFDMNKIIIDKRNPDLGARLAMESNPIAKQPIPVGGYEATRVVCNKQAISQLNLSLSIKNLLLFPELENHYEIFEAISGIQMTLCLQGVIDKYSLRMDTIPKVQCLIFLSSLQIPFGRQ